MREGLDLRLALRTGPLEAAQERMASLVSRIGADNVFIVSKVGHHGEQLWTQVLDESGFYRATGMQPANVHWVPERTGNFGKAPVVRRLGLTHFIDDRFDVLNDIWRDHYEMNKQAPMLHIAPTTTWDSYAGQAYRSDRDRQQEQTFADRWSYVHFAEHLGEVPLPDPLARPPAN